MELPTVNHLPKWFGPSLVAARHADALSALPRWKRWLHRIFIAPRCPACMYWKENCNGR